MTKKIITGLIVVAIIFVASILIMRIVSPEDNWVCNEVGEWVKHGWPNSPQPTTSCRTAVGLPNPASVHCEEVGGTLDIRTDASGGQIGYCVFPDKSECEEWALLRNECFDNSSTVASSSPGGEDFRNLNLKEGDQIKSPLKIVGEVKGGWFFEASFPIMLVNWDGLIIGEGLAQAKTDWQTADYVSFEAEIKFTKPANPTNQDYAKRGAIIFKKDNPSGLPAYDKAYELPIKF